MTRESTFVEIRKKMVGLPLQRSAFDRLHTAGSVIGLESALRYGRLNATLDTRGNLYVDPVDMAALAAAFPTRPDEAFLVQLDTERRVRCVALLGAIAQAREAAAGGDATNMRSAACELLDRLADFAPYPLLTKIVPALLREVMVSQGATQIPSAPSPSPGMRLTRALERLASWCRARGLSAKEMADAWPNVPVEAGEAVRLFCATHTGFGPVPWEAPGFDSARYTLMAVASLGPVDDDFDAADQPSFKDITVDLDRPSMTLGGVLEGWLELTDLQIWFMRNTFYLGLVPLLAQLGSAFGRSPDHLLFVTRHELEGAIPTIPEIERRMATYEADDAYLERNAVAPLRLSALFEEAPFLSR